MRTLGVDTRAITWGVVGVRIVAVGVRIVGATCGVGAAATCAVIGETLGPDALPALLMSEDSEGELVLPVMVDCDGELVPDGTTPDEPLLAGALPDEAPRDGALMQGPVLQGLFRYRLGSGWVDLLKSS